MANVLTAGNPRVYNDETLSASADMQSFSVVAFVLLIGSVPAGGSVAAVVQEDNASNFSGATNVAGSDITTINDTNDNRQVVVIVRAASLTKRYARLAVTASAHNIGLAAVAIGLAGADGATVLQRLTV